jgi:hypothetical protein
VSLEDLTLIDILWTVSIGLANVDTLRGADYQTRHLSEALDAGEPYRVCRALAAEVAYTAGAGEKGRRRTDRLLRTAAELADRLDDDHARGLVSLAEGVGASLQGEWARALSAVEAAEVILRDTCTNVWWERNSAQQVAHRSLVMLGRFRDLAGRVPRQLREAQERGDLYAATGLMTGLPNLVLLAAGDADGARARADDAMGRWSRGGFHVQHYDDLLAQTHIDLYRGDARAARDRVVARWPALENSRLRRVQLRRVLSSDLHARAALAAGDIESARRRSRELRGEGAAWIAPLADLIDAGIAHHRGDREAAIGALRAALDGAEGEEMALHAEVARLCLGALVGGDAGTELRVRALAWFSDEGIRSPERMARIFAPGLPGA